MNIDKIQDLLKVYKLDGWLFSDFHGHDFISRDFLQLTERTCSRRLFYYIPAQGTPVRILSAIEPLLLDHLTGDKVLYHGRDEMTRVLSEFLTPGSRIACQYSPEGNVPVVSSMDAGLIEYLRSLGIIPVSSADLLQHFGAVLTDEQIQSHEQAGIIIHRILDRTFAWIRTSLNEGRAIDEWMLLQQMKQIISREPIYMDSPPFFGIDEHSCDPGYEPRENGSLPIHEGSRLIIDIAGRLPTDTSIYYDVSWCMNVGSEIDPEYQRIFDLVHQARSKALSYIKNCLVRDLPLRGCDVDALTRSFFRDAGMESCIMHRTGHNIGHSCHGIGANLDDYESHDDRSLLPGTMFSIEPGLYSEKYGVRLEYDVHITTDRQVRIYGPVQDEILII